MEAAEIDVRTVCKRRVILQITEIPQVATQAEVVVEVPHNAGAEVIAEVVVGDGVEVEQLTVRRADEADAAVTYGRTPAPCVPPIGIPTITLPIAVSTLLLPKSLLSPKKLGE